jgi:hypothetical protein
MSNKNKPIESADEVSIFPEGHVMNSWQNDGREIDINSARTRQDSKRTDYSKLPSRHRGNLWFPKEQIPEGWQYAWFTERLLGEPQNDNLQEGYENGWDFVKQSDHPEYMVRELYANPDNRIRRRNNILMKKPIHEYLISQQESEEENMAKQKEIACLTDYLGNGPNTPRYLPELTENSGNYTPNYVHRR